MKKVNFFAMLAAAALMTGVTSCSNDDNVGDGGPEGQGKSASLTISIKNPSGTRAIDNATTPMASDDNTVTNLTAYVFDGNGACLASKYFSTTTHEHDGFSRVKIDGITTAAAEVYVVANAGNQETLAAVGSAKTALIAKTQTLGSQFTKRWATGSVVISSTDWTASGTDGTMSAHVDATLEFMAARIVVKVVNGMTGYDASDAAKIKLDSVGVLSVISESLLFENAGSLVPGTKAYWTGLDVSNFTSTTETKNPLLADQYDNTTNATSPADQTFYYYVYENDATTAAELPTIVTVQGVVTDLAGDGSNVKKTFYYPVHLAGYESFTTNPNSADLSKGVERGKSYEITITIKADPTETGGNGGGTIDPLIPVQDGEILLDIKIEDWVPVTLGKTFD